MTTLSAPPPLRPQARRQAPRNIAAAIAKVRRPPSAGRIARRRFLLLVAKLMLPSLALLLLVSIAIWPQVQHQLQSSRLAYRRISSDIENGRLTDARYRGVDERGRPYAFTATSALQVTPERINLTQPKGDIVTESGAWVMLQADQGVFLQHSNKLDLSGHVVLYRDDGTTLRTATASVDLKQGAASGADTVSVEGPFGTLDASGFTAVDKAAVIQFTGPARMILNGHTQ
jgi:lipopolysaccharide export system protein LptC